jgi:hypothetical protein
MKKIFLIISLFIVFLFFFSEHVSAHFLTTDGSMEGILHIDPNDEPVPLSPAIVSFDLKDTQNKFAIHICDCTFFIMENGQKIYTQSVAKDRKNVRISYTFPKKDVYEVQLVGKPHTAFAFQPFTLTWDIRVDGQGGTNGNQNISFTKYSSFIILVLFLFVAMYIIQKRSRKK